MDIYRITDRLRLPGTEFRSDTGTVYRVTRFDPLGAQVWFETDDAEYPSLLCMQLFDLALLIESGDWSFVEEEQ